MEELSYVGEESHKMVLALESALLSLPEEVGVRFASVKATPVPGGKCSHVSVAVGVVRDLEEIAGAALVQSVAARVAPDLSVSAQVFRGSDRPSLIRVDGN